MELANVHSQQSLMPSGRQWAQKLLVGLRCAGHNTTAHVVDQCLGCGSADLNLSVPAFSALGDIALGLLPVSWSIVRCNDTVGGGVLIRNHADAVATLEYSKKEVGPWTKLTRRDDNYFIATGLDTPVFFRVNSTLGKSILDSNMVPLENGGIVISSGQF
ncbi:hypothetical protein L0F63_003889 [Massospora cicadina]|nr:hypothetical protein L0F63_003889 [Massospora cicadina]